MGFSRSPGPSPTPNFPEFPPASSPFPPLVRPPRPPLAWSAEPGKCSAELRAQEPPPGAPGMGAQVAGVVPPTLPQPTRSRPPRSRLRWGSPPGSSIRPQCAGSRSPSLGQWPPLRPTTTTSSSSRVTLLPQARVRPQLPAQGPLVAPGSGTHLGRGAGVWRGPAGGR